MGDSITQGFLHFTDNGPLFSNESYPTRLFEMINKTQKYEVLNYGKESKCALKNKSCSYWDTPEYAIAMASKPDIVTIMLGTNDAYL